MTKWTTITDQKASFEIKWIRVILIKKYTPLKVKSLSIVYDLIKKSNKQTIQSIRIKD